MDVQTFLDAVNTDDAHVYLMCGIAGSGKTTLAKQLVDKGFERLSIDEYIWKEFGKYGIDYPPEKYPQLQKEAEYQLEQQLIAGLKQKQPLVIDYSFWSRANRQKYKALIESFGSGCTLVFLKVNYQILKMRLEKRSLNVDANAAFAITDELLHQYYAGFEEPVNENAIIIEAD